MNGCVTVLVHLLHFKMVELPFIVALDPYHVRKLVDFNCVGVLSPSMLKVMPFNPSSRLFVDLQSEPLFKMTFIGLV